MEYLDYIEAIQRGMGYDESQMNDVCVNILTTTDSYPLSYIEFETENLMGIRTTRADFTEGFVVLNKTYITSIQIVYANDIIFKVPNDVSYG